MSGPARLALGLALLAACSERAEPPAEPLRRAPEPTRPAARPPAAADPVMAELERMSERPREPDARALVARGDWAAALARLDADTERDAAHWSLRGRCHHRLGALDESLRCYERALQLAPDHLAAHGGAAEVLIASNRLGEAVPHLRRYAELTPDAAEQRKAREAADQIDRGARRGDPVLDALGQHASQLNRGASKAAELREVVSLLNAGRPAEAAAILAGAVVRDPADPQLRILFARALRQDRRYDEAARELTRAFELAPQDARAFAERAQLHVARKAYPAALADFERALQLEDDESARARLRDCCAVVRRALDTGSQVGPKR